MKVFRRVTVFAATLMLATNSPASFQETNFVRDGEVNFDTGTEEWFLYNDQAQSFDVLTQDDVSDSDYDNQAPSNSIVVRPSYFSGTDDDGFDIYAGFATQCVGNVNANENFVMGGFISLPRLPTEASAPFAYMRAVFFDGDDCTGNALGGAFDYISEVIFDVTNWKEVRSHILSPAGARSVAIDLYVDDITGVDVQSSSSAASRKAASSKLKRAMQNASQGVGVKRDFLRAEKASAKQRAAARGPTLADRQLLQSRMPISPLRIVANSTYIDNRVAVRFDHIYFGNQTGSCIPDEDTLCLNDYRFEVEIDWATANNQGVGFITPGTETNQSANFWFFSPDNSEVLLKVLNACGFTQAPRFWTFISAGTNQAYQVRIRDLTSGANRSYSNPLGQAAVPVQDTNSFNTCNF